MINEPDILWARLQNFRLSTAQNQSIIENQLPFGMKRQLKPLEMRGKNMIHMKGELIEIKDPGIYNFGIIRPRIPLRSIDNKLKFIPHKLTSKIDSKKAKNVSIQFDPCAILFFNESNETIKTNLTSNVNGTVSCDKSYLGAILKQSCWLVSLPDLLSFPCPFMPQTMNNKLRGIKYAEFLAEEWKNLERFDEEVEFISLIHIDKDEMDDEELKVLRSKREGNMKIFIVHEGNFMEVKCRSVKLKSDDLIVIIKSNESEQFVKKISSIKFLDSDDIESKILDSIKEIKFRINSLIVSKVQTKSDPFNPGNDQVIKYISHLDTKIGIIVTEPIPGPFGCTTRHSVIYREGYFGAIHHDASKINRFSDTINYIIRKLLNPNNLGRRLDQEGEDCVLKRISDIQYFAYLISLNEKVLLGLGGGAKCILISESFIEIFEIPILLDLSNYLSKHCKFHFILLSPHFPSFLIKSINNFQNNNIKEYMNELLRISGVDTQSFKVSMAHFIIKT